MHSKYAIWIAVYLETKVCYNSLVAFVVASSSKGRTCGSEPQNLGSNPSEASLNKSATANLFNDFVGRFGAPGSRRRVTSDKQDTRLVQVSERSERVVNPSDASSLIAVFKSW